MEQIPMPLTQKQIAEHLDLDQSAVSRMLGNLSIAWRDVSLDEIRIIYLRKLRAEVAAHRSKDGADLIYERILTERVDRELKQFNLAEKKAQLINIAQLEPELMQMVEFYRSEMLSRDDKLKAHLDALYGINLDLQILNDYTFVALKHLARYDREASDVD